MIKPSINRGFVKLAGLVTLSLGLCFASLTPAAYADSVAPSLEAQWLDRDMGCCVINVEGTMFLPLQGAFQALDSSVTLAPDFQQGKIKLSTPSGDFQLYQRQTGGGFQVAASENGPWSPMLNRWDGRYISLDFLQSLSHRTLAVTGPQLSVVDFAPSYDANGQNTNPVWKEHLQAYSNPTSGITTCANNYLGVPYVYGGMSPAGFDCSGFTSYVYAQNGIGLPRTAAGQRNVAQWISEDQARPGDLVFWGYPSYHVGIYLGGGSYIHSPAPGQGVRIQHKSQYAFSSLGRIA